ncbi:Rpn family recombination-promoting nuclease/putative transposase [Leclercia adecarboxylata]|uniref:Rpn family recombination-promoting nuclease/putative transposase n=1 Tax=Leclercia adecarboxylata TaxID=83655 RepID=UPI002DB58E67|nr:Rpn family recombination-promoting nuclease/putative transposase [Leclercia adecarboxylata]MEB6378508.1 Rpn family recombination-promoting nuclease/putative transposase [Leclercia adecarboxylata]
MHSPSTPTPHDAVFRKILSQPEAARDFLAIHLPEKFRVLCDLSSLCLESGSFVEEDLRLSYSDVLYSVNVSSGAGYIYVLIEHQSTPDRHMAFRLMRYAIAAMQRHLEKGYRELPLVIPLLFYHGKTSPYPWSLRWLDSFALSEQAESLYTGAFPLVDITCIPDKSIMQHRRVAMLELLQKHIRQRDMLELHEHLVSLLALGYTSHAQLKTLLNYLLQAGHTADPAAFLQALAQRTKDHQHKETLMNIAQFLREEGMAQGLSQGISQGRAEGIEQEALRIAKAMLENGLQPEMVARLTGLAPEIVERARH